MKKNVGFLFTAAVTLLSSALAVPGVIAQAPTQPATQTSTQPPYLNTQLPAEERARDLVSRMTLQEKASQLVNQARAIPRLKVPAYDWWSEALHGVAVDGTTEFPEPIGLGATFDPATIHTMAAAIGTEARVVHQQSEQDGASRIFHGLDFWAPNVNIFRDPRWGRGQETYGEDPFLTAQMAVSFVTGMQGDNPKYYRVIATPKHFDVHSGPEPTRHFADVDVSRHDEVDTYQPAFRAAIVQGKAGSIMCSYNAVKGQPACANQYLLQDLLRGHWGFQGYVVSDCDAVQDIYNFHHYRPTQAQSTAISMERGMDNECADFMAKVKGDADYRPYIDAVQQGYLSQSAMNTALVRLFTARIRLGMFDPPSLNPYAKIDPSQLNSPAHRELARKLADESMVLLKNDGTLPIQPSVHSIAVVGPLADQTNVLLGNYNGIPKHTVTMLEGLRAAYPGVAITYVPGTQFLLNQGIPVPADRLSTPDGKPGLLAEYTNGENPELSNQTSAKPFAQRIEPQVDLSQANLPAAAAGKKQINVQWTGVLHPAQTGDYLLGVRGDGHVSVQADGKIIAEEWRTHGVESKLGRIHLEKGTPVTLKIEYTNLNGVPPTAQLLWAPVDYTPSPAAVQAAENADLVIAVVGITSQLEGEEMPVSEPGFLGGDRTSLDLPQPEEALVEAVAATHKPLVVVLMNGSALSVNWIQQHANAVLEAWYSGEEGGDAIADTLSGRNNPAGRLPVTFYKDVSQLPNFENYSMENRTYRYFTGQPLYPFGYGLSYTTFAYSHLSLPASDQAGSPLDASATVTNTGKVAGDEVVQLYLKFPQIAGAPRLALRGFQRLHLEPGESRQVSFELKNRDLSMVTQDGDPIVAPGNYTLSIGGGQPGAGAPSVTGHFRIDGQIGLSQ